uniref:hypothetical protein n=1 Tax=Prevotella sp. TaxID=59823 RepID=UPI003FEE3129
LCRKYAASQQNIQASLMLSVLYLCRKYAASQQNIQASLMLCIRFAVSLQSRNGNRLSLK